MNPHGAGKGDANRTSDFAAYRSSRLWWRSSCCNAKVNTRQLDPDDKRVNPLVVYYCLDCDRTCILKP